MALLPALVGLVGCCIMDVAPQANFSWNPQEPLAHVPVQFTDLSTDSGGPLGSGGVVAWDWDFGDGSSASSQNPTHTYTQPGNYQVRLTVTDSCGLQDSTTKTITVGASLDGRWTGSIWDLIGNQFQFELVLNHSGPGNITGTAYVTGLSSPLISISFNPTTRQIQFSFAYAGTGNIWLFVGTYDPNLDCMEGYWENITTAPGRKVGDWRVCRQ